jgi:hypothetical protein
MKPRMYNIIREAVENGIRYGIRRAHKHTDDPSEDLLESEIHSAIMNELDDKFEFEIPRLD